MFTKFKFREYDFKLVIMILLLSVIGIIAVGSAEPTLRNKQLAGVVAGTALMIFISLFNYKWVMKLYWLMYIANLGLLIAVWTLGDEGKYGAQRWLGIGGLRFQPSELAKILLILFFAQFIMKYKDKLNTFRVLAASKGTVIKNQNFVTARGVYQIIFVRYENDIYFFKHRNGQLVECCNLSNLGNNQDKTSMA